MCATLKNGLILLVALVSFVPWLGGCTETQVAKAPKAEFMFWPPAPDEPRIQFLTSISSSADVTRKSTSMEEFLYGKSTVTDLPFERPYGVRMYDGKIFICDATAANVSVLDIRNKEVRVLGTTGQVHLSKPIDIAVSPDGAKYVADTGYGAVLVFDREDKYAGKVAVKNMRPVSVAVFGNDLYVSDLGSSIVRVFDRFNGKEKRTIGAPGGEKGQFGGTMGLTLDKQGNVYVNDVLGCKVQKFAPDGTFIYAIGGLGEHPGQFVRPKMMAVDDSGILYVVDFAFENVQMFNEKGEWLMHFGGEGDFPGGMNAPTGVCVSDADMSLFAQYVHPAFDAKRLVIVTNNTGAHKINIYALGELKPGKTVADIAGGRIQGIFGFASETDKSNGLDLSVDGTTQPSPTQPGATKPAATQEAATTRATSSDTKP
jgi:DNA-binding beta-propeller fold protein YncE